MPAAPVFQIGCPKDEVVIDLAHPHFLAFGTCENARKAMGWLRKQGDQQWTPGTRVRRLNPARGLPAHGPWAIHFDLSELPGKLDLDTPYEFCVRSTAAAPPRKPADLVVFRFVDPSRGAAAGKKKTRALALSDTFRISVPLASATPTICPHFWVYGMSSGDSTVTVEVREGTTLLTSHTANSTGTLWSAEITVTPGTNRTIYAFDDDENDSQGTFTHACAQCPDPTHCV